MGARVHQPLTPVATKASERGTRLEQVGKRCRIASGTEGGSGLLPTFILEKDLGSFVFQNALMLIRICTVISCIVSQNNGIYSISVFDNAPCENCQS